MTDRDVERTFLIADLSGYTALTEAHGNVGAAKVVARYVELARAALVPGARILERVGDELVFVGDDPAPVVETARRLRDAIETEPRFPRIRMGIHVGGVLERDGQFFGTALNVAARVTEYARAGQLLCTEAVAARLPGLTGRALGPVRFKNLAAPIDVLEITDGEAGRAAKTIDPVCRMQVDEDAPARLPWGGRVWWFCSFECAHAFAEHPEDYATV